MIDRSLAFASVALSLLVLCGWSSAQELPPFPQPPPAAPDESIPQPLPPVSPIPAPTEFTAASADAEPKSVSARLAEMERELQKLKDGEQKKKTEDAKKPSIKVRGRLQADAAWFSQDPVSHAAVGDIQDGADIRRARIGAQGAAFQVTEYVFEVDFARGNVVLDDVFLQVNELPVLGAFRVGHFFEPFSLEQVTSDNYTMFLERGLPFALATERNWGLASYNHNEDQSATWGYGIFRTGSNGSADDVGDNGEWSFTTRATWLPYYDEPSDGRYLLHLGGSYSYRDADTDLVQFASTPEVVMTETGVGSVPNFVNTGAIAADVYQLYGTEAAWVNGPLSIQSEFIGSRVDALVGDPLFFWAAYTYASYSLTGESRNYRRQDGTFSGLVPSGNFFCVRTDNGICKGPGAWELAARLSYLDLDDGSTAGGRLFDTTLGLNWWLNPYVRIMFNYIHADLDRPPAADSSTDIFAIRFHCYW